MLVPTIGLWPATVHERQIRNSGIYSEPHGPPSHRPPVFGTCIYL